MDYEKETVETYNSLREKYTDVEIAVISRHLLALSVSLVIAKNGCDEQQKNKIFEWFKKHIPKDIEDCLKIVFSNYVSDTIR